MRTIPVFLLMLASRVSVSPSRSCCHAASGRIAEVGVSDPEASHARGVLKPIPPEYDQKYVDLWEEVRLGL